MINIDKVENYILKQDNSNKDKIRDNIFEFIINKQFYCAVAYAKVCKLREDEYNKDFDKEIKIFEQKAEEVETEEDFDKICEQIDKIKSDKFYYFSNLYIALAYAFDDPWYDDKKFYDTFKFKDKNIENKDFISFFTSSDDKNFIYLLFLSIAIRALYSKKTVYWNSLQGQLPKDSGCYNTKLKNIIEELLKDVINDIESFKEKTGTVLSTCSDKKHSLKDKKNINNIDEDIKNLENLRNTFLNYNTNLVENEMRRDIFGDRDSIVYKFYKDAIKKQNTRDILSDIDYQVEILDDNKINFDKSVDIIKKSYNKIISKNNKYSKNSQEYDDKIVDDLNGFLNDILNFLYKCDNYNSSYTSKDNAYKKYIIEYKDYVEHLKEAIEKLKEKQADKKDNGYIAGISILEYILEYIRDSISIETEENDYKYEYGKYFYVPFLLSNHVMLNDDFLPDFPILYNYKFEKQKIGNFFVESIQPEYRIIKQAKEFQYFNYTISDFKRELRLRQNKEENNKYNYSSKELVSKYDLLFPNDNDIGNIEKAEKRASGDLSDFIGELELALWYRQLEEKLQSKKDKLDKASEDRAYKLYVNIRNNIEEWYHLLCETKKNYYLFKQVVIGYLDRIKDNIYKLKYLCLKEFNDVEKDKDSKEKKFFEKFYKVLENKIDIKEDKITFKVILDYFIESEEDKEYIESDEYKKIRDFFEEFYNIVFRQHNFSMFSTYLNNFEKCEFNKLSSSIKLDEYLAMFMDRPVFNDSKRDVDNIDDGRPLKIRVVLGKDCSDISTAQKLADYWDNIFLSEQDKIDESFIKKILDDLGFGSNVLETLNKSSVKIFLDDLGLDFNVLESLCRFCIYPLINYRLGVNVLESLHKVSVKKLLDDLGFGVNEIKRDSKITFVSDEQVFVNNFKVKLSSKRFNHPIDAFGADAVKKAFRVICIDRDKIGYDDNVDFLVNFIKKIGTDYNTMILLDHSLTLSDRRTLAKKIKTEVDYSKGEINTLFLILDRVAMSFLMKHYNKEKINKMLLSILSPFGFYQPYKPSIGFGGSDENSLDEIFIGRKDELTKIKKINDEKDTINIVYGGRQLGKSSLLQRATKDINEKNNGSRAIYINFESLNKNSNDSSDEPYYMKALKFMVDNYLKEDKSKINNHGIFDENIKINDWDDFKEEVRKVFQSKEKNISSLILLIDEADNFFSDEANIHIPMKTFSEIVRYANSYDKKFKVVFAGLNMIKDYRILNDKELKDKNHSFGQFDEENYIEVRPFNDKDARELIELPLRYLGLYFSQDYESLIYLILDKTNYYPCLIQLYCKKMLIAMCEANYAHYKENRDPVYYVNTEHIKDVLSDKGFLGTVKEKFDITLDLSPTVKEDHTTYRYLANILAYLCHTKGYSSYEINDFLDVAKKYNIKHICDLADENKLELYMKHLHQLSVFSYEKDVKKYGFRRLPLYQLMGTYEEICREIKSFSLDK